MPYKINGHVVAPGSISTGTLKEEDLMKSFSEEIKKLILTRPKILFEAECWLGGPQVYADNDFAEAFPNDTIEEVHESIAGSILMDMVAYLNSIACEGLYFGTHPGDGADFGWWEVEEEEQ